MPDPIDLNFAINLPPRRAIAYFKSKGYTISWDWWDTWQQAHTKVFTVAKVTQLDILRDIREELLAAMEEGLSLGEFQERLTPRLKARGWWGKAEDPETGEEIQLGSPYRLKTIYRTNLQTAYQVGRWESMKGNADNRPYLQYIAVMDRKTRPSHAALNGQVYHVNDPIWNTLAPPNGWGCRCRLRAFSQRDLERRGITPATSDTQQIEADALLSARTGELVRVKGVRAPNGTDVLPDPGWSYNPGQEHYQPDLSQYPPDLVQAYVAAQQRRAAP